MQKPLALLYILRRLNFKHVLCFTNSIDSTHRLSGQLISSSNCNLYLLICRHYIGNFRCHPLCNFCLWLGVHLFTGYLSAYLFIVLWWDIWADEYFVQNLQFFRWTADFIFVIFVTIKLFIFVRVFN